MTQQHLSLSAAIREAATYGTIVRDARGEYHVFTPYSHNEPNGPSGERAYPTRAQARAALTASRAHIALHLMGRATAETACAVEIQLYDRPYAAHDLRSVVTAAAQRYVGDATTA